MKTAKRTAEVERMDDAAWLSELVAGAHEEIANQPSATAVQRIRARLLAKLERPERKAA